MPDLQSAWFLLVGVLIVGYAILDGFDLGVGMLHLFLARDDGERRTLLATIAPVWDGNEVWLLTAGGALFAAFPAVYATVFSGLYLALMLLLTALILRAVAVEFRSKRKEAGWRRFWDGAFAVGSFLPALLLGVAVGNVARGVPLTADGEFAGSFLGLLNPFAVVVGLVSVAMFVMQGGAWIALKTEGVLQGRARRAAFGGWVAFVLLWAVMTVVSRGQAPHLWGAFASARAWAAPVAFVLAAALFPLALRTGRGGLTFLFSSAAIAALLGILGQGLYPVLVPGLGDLERSLTIRNASSSAYTLRTMLVIALTGMPLVVAYTVFIYTRFRGRVTADEPAY